MRSRSQGWRRGATERSPPDPLYIRAPDARLPAPEITRADFTAAPVLAALHAECFSAPWSADDFATLAGSPGAVALIGRLRGEPAGFVLARQAAGEIEILTIGTRPAFRRKGIARALAAALIERVTGAGGAVIFIEVATGNAAARSLYGALGFGEVGRRKGYYASARTPSSCGGISRLGHRQPAGDAPGVGDA